jgi:hypothetical protein
VTVLDYSRVGPIVTGRADVDAAHAIMREADGTWRAARAHGVSDDLVRELAKDYVEKSVAYQRLAYGNVRCRPSVAALLR